MPTLQKKEEGASPAKADVKNESGKQVVVVVSSERVRVSRGWHPPVNYHVDF